VGTRQETGTAQSDDATHRETDGEGGWVTVEEVGETEEGTEGEEETYHCAGETTVETLGVG